MMTMLKEVSFKNERIRYHVQNPDSKNAAFLFHGLGDTKSCFDGLSMMLQREGLKTVSIDWPGHGDNVSISMAFEELPLLLFLVYKNEKGTHNYFFGHSLGGLVALLALKTLTIPYTHFTSVESPLTDGDKAFFHSLQEPPVGAGVQSFLSRTSLLEQKPFHGWQEKLQAADPATLRQYVKHVYQHFDDYRQLPATVGLSFEYVYGARSSNPEQREQLNDLPGVRAVCLPDAFHWAHLDAPEAFAAYVTASVLPLKQSNRVEKSDSARPESF